MLKNNLHHLQEIQEQDLKHVTIMLWPLTDQPNPFRKVIFILSSSGLIYGPCHTIHEVYMRRTMSLPWKRPCRCLMHGHMATPAYGRSLQFLPPL
jgi:hypothetical protein